MLYIYSGCPFVLHTKAQMCHLGQRSSLKHLSQISLVSEKNNKCKEVQKNIDASVVELAYCHSKSHSSSIM